MTFGALGGLRVVDCSTGLAGQRASALLADHGADVIWIEPPEGGWGRRLEPIASAVSNRGKRSAVVDLKQTAERERLFDLLGTADVFIESWAPGVADRLGLGYEAVHARLPGLIYCSISGFGVDDPHSDEPGFEPIVFALLGTLAEQRGHREGPIFQGIPFASIGAAYVGLIGILASLYRRAQDQSGRHVETSLLDGALAYHSLGWGETDASPGQPAVSENLRLINRAFLCADDEYLGVHTGAIGAFGRLMNVLKLDDRIPPSETGLDLGLRLTGYEKKLLSAELDTIFHSRPRAEWVVELLKADICTLEHLHPTEVFDQAQAIHNDMIVEVDDPVFGRIQQAGIPAKFARTPGAVTGPTPTLGQHTAEVLGEVGIMSGWQDPHAGGIPDRGPILAGLKVLDFGQFFAGPYSSRLLADLGADVIKLEPVAGDSMRGIERVFASAQAGKRSIAADLKDVGLRNVASKLVAWADVIHHNLRPGAAERLGLGYADVQAINPEIIYLYAPGWGSSGPHCLRQSFAPHMSGFVGAAYECGGQFNPPMPTVGNEDPGNGLLGAVGALMALLHRQRSGEGQYVENPQLNAAMAHTAHIVRRADGEVLGAGRLDPLQLGFGPLERLYQTADGWICLVAGRDQDIPGVGEVIGVDLLADKRFATRDVRGDNDYVLGDLLSSAFRARTTAELVKALTAQGVPAVEPTPKNMSKFLSDPVQRRIGRTAELTHPDKGNVRELALLVRIGEAEVVPHRLNPELGEHTDEILTWLGYQPDDIEVFRKRGAVT